MWIQQPMVGRVGRCGSSSPWWGGWVGVDPAAHGGEGGDVWIQQPMVRRVGMCGFSSQR